MVAFEAKMMEHDSNIHEGRNDLIFCLFLQKICRKISVLFGVLVVTSKQSNSSIVLLRK